MTKINVASVLFILLEFVCKPLLSQDIKSDKIDSTATIKLNAVIIEANKENNFGITRLKQVEGTAIYAGKKSEVILIEDVNGNIATNNTRQVFAKVAGLNVWESDGAGIQLGIGGRGLNPNRVSNFNTRQNGYDISADALGYPESYYTPPVEGLERIEVVRGAASLQYGTQFGGFINFKMKQAPSNKAIELTARQTLGSFGFYSNFTSLGGTRKKVSYYTFYQYKNGNGWRPNSGFKVHTAFAALSFQLSAKLKLSTEYTFMNYLAQQPGGLTDKQFQDNPRQSNRLRNWFGVNWNLAAVVVNYKFNERTQIDWRTFGLYAQRDALGNLSRIDRPDANLERDYLQDKFRNYGSELRFLIHYPFVKSIFSTFLVGARYYKGNTLRKQGNGSDNNDADFRFLRPDNLEHSNYSFPSENIALFSENVFRIGSKFSLTPGIRIEHINTNSIGYYREEYKDLAGNILFQQNTEDNRTSSRNFILGGIGLGYKLTTTIDMYANFSQNYRSINFNDMRIVNPNSKVDPNLQDEKGYSSDLGIRGNLKQLLYFDVSLFYLKYDKRIGSIQKVETLTFQIYRYRTNLSDSRNAGIETFAELDVLKLFKTKTNHFSASFFVNYTFLNAQYLNSNEPAVKNGNRVEYTPEHILRSGINLGYKKIKATCQYAYTSSQYSEATNAISTVSAVDGLIPAYSVMDLSLSYSFKWFMLSTSVNNLTNASYFTRRADGYPGPGIIPSDGRSYFVTLQVKL
jgi:Fe(3+) dicitrate transport protein